MDCFGRKKLYLITKEIWYLFHKSAKVIGYIFLTGANNVFFPLTVDSIDKGGKNENDSVAIPESVPFLLNPIALRKAKIVFSFVLSAIRFKLYANS